MSGTSRALPSGRSTTHLSSPTSSGHSHRSPTTSTRRCSEWPTSTTMDSPHSSSCGLLSYFPTSYSYMHVTGTINTSSCRYFKTNEAKLDYSRFIFNYLNFALIILDNMHFQYNSMMYGIMILSLAYIREVYNRMTIIEIVFEECIDVRDSSEFQTYLSVLRTVFRHILSEKVGVQSKKRQPVEFHYFGCINNCCLRCQLWSLHYHWIIQTNCSQIVPFL